MAEVRDYAMEKATQESEKPIFCQIEGCIDRQGLPTQITHVRGFSGVLVLCSLTKRENIGSF